MEFYIPFNFQDYFSSYKTDQLVGGTNSLCRIFFSCRTAVWQTAFFLQEKIQFCWTVLCVIIVILVIFAAHLSDRIKYFVRQIERPREFQA